MKFNYNKDDVADLLKVLGSLNTKVQDTIQPAELAITECEAAWVVECKAARKYYEDHIHERLKAFVSDPNNFKSDEQPQNKMIKLEAKTWRSKLFSLVTPSLPKDVPAVYIVDGGEVSRRIDAVLYNGDHTHVYTRYGYLNDLSISFGTVDYADWDYTSNYYVNEGRGMWRVSPSKLHIAPDYKSHERELAGLQERLDTRVTNQEWIAGITKRLTPHTHIVDGLNSTYSSISLSETEFENISRLVSAYSDLT